MDNFIQQIKDARKKYGFTLKEAYDFVRGNLEERNPVDARKYKNQQTITHVWKRIQYPYGGEFDAHPIVGTAEYGQHIRIICSKCGAEGTTKNISPLGCRTLFINCSCKNWNGLKTVDKPLTKKDFEAKI